MRQVNLEDSSGLVKATIDCRGAALVGMSFENRQLVAKSNKSSLYSGVVMAPWSGRIRSGIWVDRLGQTRELPKNEPERNNSIHGLVYNVEFDVVEQGSDYITLETELPGSDGYPYRISLQISYRLSAQGLACKFVARNLSDVDAEFAIGFHPYFLLSGVAEKDTLIQSSAKSLFRQTLGKMPDQKISVHEQPQSLLEGKVAAGAELDDYYTDLDFRSGKASTRLISPSGDGFEVWQESIFQHLVIYTTDEYSTAEGLVSAIAVEPSTSAINALNSKDGLILIGQGESVEGSWGIASLRSFAPSPN